MSQERQKMDIQIRSRRKIHGLGNRKIKQKLKTVLSALGCRDVELSIFFTDDEEISRLNQRYLGKTGPTNVLAFPISGGPPPDPETGMLGDVVISVETATSESKSIGEPLDETIFRLLIHGILHLLNYDHERSADDADMMEAEQRRLLSLIREA